MVQHPAPARLQLGEQATTITDGEGRAWTLALGTQATAQRFFAHAPPTPLELEEAIAAVEDEVMRVRPPWRVAPLLLGDDVALQRIAAAAGRSGAGEALLDLDTVERLFDRLAAVSLGRPAAHEGLPEDAAFAAALLIVRELLHHLGIAGIRVIQRLAVTPPST